MKTINLSLPITILLASIILGGFFYASQVNKQRSIERQQEIKLEQERKETEAKFEQENKEYVAKRKTECYELYKERDEMRSNVESYFYNEERDVCIVMYKTDKYKGVNCSEKYKGNSEKMLDCILGVFTKEY